MEIFRTRRRLVCFLLVHGRPFLRILFVGDVFGQAGRRIVSEHLWHHGLLWGVEAALAAIA
jgi:hypothetical protein